MGPAQRALIVEDDADICELVRIVLRADNFALDMVHDGQTGLEKALSTSYDLIILDLMLPRLDGWQICRQLRSHTQTRGVPIVMLTAKGEETDKVLGLELGADDYITKPFRPREFLARIKALMRRSTGYNQPEEIIRLDGLTIFPHSYQAKIGNVPIELTPKEFELLHKLALNPGRTLTRDQLLTQVWGFDYPGSTRTVDEHIKRIRHKMAQADSSHSFIHTVWGIGYRFEVKKNDP